MQNLFLFQDWNQSKYELCLFMYPRDEQHIVSFMKIQTTKEYIYHANGKVYEYVWNISQDHLYINITTNVVSVKCMQNGHV